MAHVQLCCHSPGAQQNVHAFNCAKVHSPEGGSAHGTLQNEFGCALHIEWSDCDP